MRAGPGSQGRCKQLWPLVWPCDKWMLTDKYCLQEEHPHVPRQQPRVTAPWQTQGRLSGFSQIYCHDSVSLRNSVGKAGAARAVCPQGAVGQSQVHYWS